MSQSRIESLEDPRLDLYRGLKKSNRIRDQHAFIAEGVRVVKRLLESDFDVLSVLATEAKATVIRSSIPDDVPVYVLTPELASILVGYKFHMGVLAAGQRPTPRPMDAVLPAAGPSLVFVADRIIDQQNMGLIVRIAAGFGADALLISQGSADPFSRRSIRVSTGNCFFLPILECSAGSLQVLARLGYTCCATVLSDQATELSAFRFPERTAIVMGNETQGISTSLVANCGQQVSISMLNGTDSLNVAVAAGIFGYAYRINHPDRPHVHNGDIA